MRLPSMKIVVTAVAICMSLYQIYTAGVQQFPAMQQRTIHLCFGLVLTFLIFPLKDQWAGSHPRLSSVLDCGLALLSILVGAYVVSQYEGISMRQGEPNLADCIVATAGIVLVIEATRRVMGFAMVALALLSLAYALFGSYLPPMFGHSGYTFQRIVAQMFLGTEGILGTALSVSATVIIIFLVFGSFLEQTGGSSAFTNLGFGLFGRFKGGAAKAAVLGSCLFGMMTGSQTANVAAVGTLTIPLMIRSGYKPMMAGAIEALSSTGGMLVPPVMGAAAFIIPEIVGGSYLDVMKAALIPGLLYYTTVFVFIQVQANKLGLERVPKAELPRLMPLVRQYGHLAVPILVILYLLIVVDVSTKLAGFWAIVTLFGVSMARKSTRMPLGKICAALENGPRTALVVVLSCASAGIIEGVINLTGLGLRFSELLIYAAGGNTLILLVLTMLASLVIGLPLPPVTAYLILAILAAPALIKAGIDPMGAHLFVFYFGVLGNITPPSAPCSFAAAGIAKTDPLKTTNLAFLISAPTFIVPYLFVYSPELTLKGSALYIAFRVIAAFVAISSLSMAFLGFAKTKLGLLERVILVAAAACLIPNLWYSNVLGCFAFVMVFVWSAVYGRMAGRPRTAAQIP